MNTILALLGGFGIGELFRDFITYKYKINSLKFEAIHKKRVEVLCEFHKKIDKAERSFQSLMAPFQGAGELSQEKKGEIAMQAGNDFLEYFSENKIYLNDSLEGKINSLNEKMRDAWITFKYATLEKEKKVEKWKESWNKVKEEIPVVNKEIRKEFRKILGIK